MGAVLGQGRTARIYEIKKNPNLGVLGETSGRPMWHSNASDTVSALPSVRIHANGTCRVLTNPCPQASNPHMQTPRADTRTHMRLCSQPSKGRKRRRAHGDLRDSANLFHQSLIHFLNNETPHIQQCLDHSLLILGANPWPFGFAQDCKPGGRAGQHGMKEAGKSTRKGRERNESP